MNHDYPELTLIREDMKNQSALYRPTSFWEQASQDITAELCQHGVDRFRALELPLGYFVPTYGYPGNSFSRPQLDGLMQWIRENSRDAKKPVLALEQALTGHAAALGDYRVLLASDDRTRLPRLHTFSESTAGTPVEQFEFDGRRFSRSALNYLLGLALLKKHLGNDPLRVVLEIGGGFGTLGEVLASAGIEQLRYVDVDIPPTSFVAQHYLTEALGREHVATYAQTRDRATIEIESLPKASVLASWQIERLKGEVDLFVNFISFQEMEPHVVTNYLEHVARLKTRWVLLRNIREGKQQRKSPTDHGVDKPIKTDDYMGMLPGYELVERGVHPFGYQTVDNFHSELLLLRRRA
jgi:putative sugar O-methyltransferase